MEVKKITKANLSKKTMREYLIEGLENHTITKKAFKEWLKEVKAIDSGESTDSEKLKAVKVAFYEKFVLPEKEKLKAKENAHPLYALFSDIRKENPIEEKKD